MKILITMLVIFNITSVFASDMFAAKGQWQPNTFSSNTVSSSHMTICSNVVKSKYLRCIKKELGEYLLDYSEETLVNLGITSAIARPLIIGVGGVGMAFVQDKASFSFKLPYFDGKMKVKTKNFIAGDGFSTKLSYTADFSKEIGAVRGRGEKATLSFVTSHDEKSKAYAGVQFSLQF